MYHSIWQFISCRKEKVIAEVWHTSNKETDGIINRDFLGFCHLEMLVYFNLLRGLPIAISILIMTWDYSNHRG